MTTPKSAAGCIRIRTSPSIETKLRSRVSNTNPRSDRCERHATEARARALASVERSDWPRGRRDATRRRIAGRGPNRRRRPSCDSNYRVLAPIHRSRAAICHRSGKRSVYLKRRILSPASIHVFGVSFDKAPRVFANVKRKSKRSRTRPRSCVRDREHARPPARARARNVSSISVFYACWIVGRSRPCMRARPRAGGSHTTSSVQQVSGVGGGGDGGRFNCTVVWNTSCMVLVDRCA